MKFSTDEFKSPEKHPFSMLAGYNLRHTNESEHFMAWMLMKALEKGSIYSLIETESDWSELVKLDLIEQVEARYRLTDDGLFLLHKHYGVSK